MPKGEGKLIAQNKRGRHDCFIEETYGVGMVLQEAEIKSIRSERVNLKIPFREFKIESYSYIMSILVHTNKEPL